MQFDAVLAHEPVGLKVTGDGVESGGVLEAELLGCLGKGDPGLSHDQGKKPVTATVGARLRRAGAGAWRRGGLWRGGRACAAGLPARSSVLLRGRYGWWTRGGP